MNGATITSLVSLAGQQIPAGSTLRGTIAIAITGTQPHTYYVIFAYRIPGTVDDISGIGDSIYGSQQSIGKTLDVPIPVNSPLGLSAAVAIVAESYDPNTGAIGGVYDSREIPIEIVSGAPPYDAEITSFSVAVV